MSATIAIIGKSGSGKTTLTNSLLTALHEAYPDKSILMVDNDLTCELGYTFGIETKDTISDIRSGKYKYKSKIPPDMTKQEFIEWALQDMVINLYDDIDIIASGMVSTKDCTCFVANQINDALIKLFKSYDIVIFDCEYDLEYLHQLVDYPIDVTLIISDTSLTSVYSAQKIKQSSLRYSSPGQLGLVMNKVKNRQVPENVSQVLSEYDLNILGFLPFDEELERDNIIKDSEIVIEAAKELMYRLNLPPL
ncbi:MAG: hypothetical protein ACD_20C00150G0006 [uncultured bacterium]|nr:MAG: hypothetical protein ACD_20C00150G0006 [uncultured bacterium]HBH18461.1 hypothetical protein [Cyanobacteria bacterium UBA9579]